MTIHPPNLLISRNTASIENTDRTEDLAKQEPLPGSARAISSSLVLGAIVLIAIVIGFYNLIRRRGYISALSNYIRSKLHSSKETSTAITLDPNLYFREHTKRLDLPRSRGKETAQEKDKGTKHEWRKNVTMSTFMRQNFGVGKGVGKKKHLQRDAEMGKIEESLHILDVGPVTMPAPTARIY